MTAQEKERITQLRGEGKSYGAIATLLGISASKVKSYCTMAKSITRIDVKKPDLLQRKRVAAYARVSMDTERLMHSLSVQVSYYSELIQNTPGWEYAGVYADEGISGTKMDSRPEFVRMLADCEAGKIDIIFTQSLSRFARNTVDTLNVVRRLKELGIEVRFEKERINSLADEGELLITIMASFAQEEVRSLSENVKRGLRKRFEQGMPNGRFHVYGYRWEGDHLVIRPDEAAIVRRIFQNFLQGKSRLETECEFAAEGTERVDHLEVPEKDRLTFFMKDGRTFIRDCRNTGHQDCWTPEYRAAVSAYRREHGTNPRGKSCFTSKIKCACGSNYQTSYQKLKDGAFATGAARRNAVRKACGRIGSVRSALRCLIPMVLMKLPSPRRSSISAYWRTAFWNPTLPMGVLFSTASTSGEAARNGRKCSAGALMNQSKASTPRNAGRR